MWLSYILFQRGLFPHVRRCGGWPETRPTNLSRGGEVFAYNVQPWAWEYLNSHPRLLE